MNKTKTVLIKRTLVAILAASSLLFAESYQVNTLSARQLGMAHTGAGLKLGSESMHFNPGGLGFLDKKLDISAGVTFIIPEVEFYGKGGKTTNTELGTPIYFYAATSITDWFAAGISFTTPYGNTVKYGKNWEGAGLLQDISLAVYAIQPTVAFKPIEQLSIGVGPAIYFGSFEQSKALVTPGQLNGLAAYGLGEIAGKYENTSAVSATFSGDADVAVAVNAGILYDIIKDKLAIGVAYRSEATVKVAKGKAKINYVDKNDIETINNFGQQYTGSDLVPIPALDQGTFEAELPLPANLNAGISFRPIEKLLLAFDLQWVGWSSYEELTLSFTDAILGVDTSGDSPVYIRSQTSKKEYHNTFAYRFGAQYTVIDQLDVRLGMYYDETPVDDDFLTPESPSTNKLGSTIGFSFRPIPNLSIDAAFLYSLGFGRNSTSGSNPEKDDGLNGRYEVQAWVPSIGLSFNF